LRDGIDDEGYLRLFKPIIRAVIEKFRPESVVLQCGADSLNCDRLGRFNLSLRGHAECVKFVKSFGLPLLVLGGGGYTIRNVARCWTNETATVLDKDISNNLPLNDYYEYFRPYYQLHPTVTNAIENINTTEYMELVYERSIEVLRGLECAPSVEMFQIPPEILLHDPDWEDKRDPDVRMSQHDLDQQVEASNEYYSGEKDH
jgi:histone deacetylase 3